ncbi:MAG: glycoside hydrolase family 127 protein [Tepidisphaeraceae bacterium]
MHVARVIAAAVFAMSTLTSTVRSEVANVVKPVQEYFPLSDLRLLDGPFHHAMELDQAYLLQLSADRLLSGFRANAGLPEKAKPYGGWESRGLSGQTAGHYLSALAQMYASTGDQRFADRLSYCIDELADCQAAVSDGFLGGMPRGRELFAEIARGDLRVRPGFDLNGGWVPWYNQHKLFAGLRDAYQLAGNEKAKAVLVRLGDWCDSVCHGLSDQQMQDMLATEQGGMLETLADLYAITGDQKFLALAKRFWHKAVLDPLAAHKDPLTGLHANTNIPKVIGAARMYELTGDKAFHDAAEQFWTLVTRDRSFVTGSNSDREHFYRVGLEASKLGPQNGETCNVYNMLKLTSHLASWQDDSKLYDFYERALFNHILGSIDPNTGMVTYFQSLQAGRFKVYASPEDSFWCCVGTGLENHAKYPQHVYARMGDTLSVNLFMASELTWKEKGLTLRQETDFPSSDTTKLTLKLGKPTSMKLQIRVPGWATKGISVEGAATATGAAGSGYLTIDRTWNDGDTITVRMPMSLSLHRAVDDPTSVAFLYGPVVLAGELGRADFPESDNVPDHTKFDSRPLPPVPALVTDDASLGWLKPVAGKPLHFTTGSVARPAGEIELAPFAQVHHQRYAVYFRMLSEAQFAAQQQKIEAERKVAAELAARTVDEVVFGEQQSEKDHDAQNERSFNGEHAGKHWRDARDGGWFSANFTVKPDVAQVLRCTYWGSDANNRVFDIVVDGQLIATQRLDGKHPEEFFDVDYPLPASLVAGKSAVTIRFQAHPGATAGGLFGCRVLTAAK